MQVGQMLGLGKGRQGVAVSEFGGMRMQVEAARSEYEGGVVAVSEFGGMRMQENTLQQGASRTESQSVNLEG